MDDPSYTTERPVKKERSPGRRYDLYGGGPVPEVFVDGLSDLLMGPYVSRLTLHTTEGLVQDSDDPIPIEQRRIKLRLVLPTATLVEIAHIVLRNASQSADLLEAVLSQNIEMYRQRQVTPPQPPASVKED